MMTKTLYATNRIGGGRPEGRSAVLHRWRGWVLALFFVLGVAAQAADVSVKASLTRGITVIGEPVQFQIKVINARREGNPPDVAVDGLPIRYLGPSTSSVTRVDQNGIRQERTTIFVYEVAPAKNGVFTIPALEVNVDGRIMKTEPVALTVQQSSVEDDGKPKVLGKVEIVPAKMSAYVGEMIPVEVRFTVDARVKWQPVAMPEIAGEGFTKQKMPEPRRPEQVVKDGRDYDVMIFKTAITPGRAGKITIGPAEVVYNAQIPRGRKSGPRSPFDIFDDDVFGDPFFAQTQQIRAKGAAVELTVKPLPAAGRPGDFSGAVGKFQFSAAGTPNRVKVGDPVTMKLRVTGRGNFDRMDAPVLKDAGGWRSYPPSGVFQKADGEELGISGTKTFEMAVIPEERKTQMPVFSFSFFDPEAEKYVTQLSDPAALQVEGAKAPAPAPVATAREAVSRPGDAADPAPATAPPAADDILGLRYEAGVRRTFEPLYERREFWLAQAGILAVLLALAGLRVRRGPDAAAAQAAALRQEKAALLAKLRGGKLAHAEFFDAAARVVQIDTALATGVKAGGVDAPAARALAGGDAALAAMIGEVFDARAELLFAGGGREEGEVTGEVRERVISSLEKFGRTYAKG